LTPSEFLKKWIDSGAAERSNAQSFLNDLCQVLNVDPPHAATSDAERDAYVFEKPVPVPHEGRPQSIGFIDFFKRGHFILEAKQGSEEGSTRLGTARRDTPAWHIAMQDDPASLFRINDFFRPLSRSGDRIHERYIETSGGFLARTVRSCAERLRILLSTSQSVAQLSTLYFN